MSDSAQDLLQTCPELKNKENPPRVRFPDNTHQAEDGVEKNQSLWHVRVLRLPPPPPSSPPLQPGLAIEINCL